MFGGGGANDKQSWRGAFRPYPASKRRVAGFAIGRETILLWLRLRLRRSPDPFEIVSRNRVVWIQAERVLELLDGFLYPVLSEEHVAQVAVRAIVLRIEANSIPKCIFSARQISV